MIKFCEYCGIELFGYKGRLPRENRKYCNPECYISHKIQRVSDRIEGGSLSEPGGQYKKYLIREHGAKCMKCGWNEKNTCSNTIPIVLNHIDGNSSNNALDNLELLCPNCDSLTPTYKGLNKGNGRHSRRKRYKEGKSY